MTTITRFTKEQLIAKAREQIAFCRNTKITGEGRVHVNQCSALFEIALASLTAEPVFFITVEGDDWIQAGRIPGSEFDFNNLPDGVVNLYAAPPAPVAVPPKQHWEELCRQHPDMSIGDAIIRAAWWNHCRAAMLNGGKS